MKVLYFDTETTGLDKEKHALIQLSGIVEVDGEVKEKFDFRIAPFPQDIVDPDALKINGITVEQLATYPKPYLAYANILKLFDKYIDKIKQFLLQSNN